MKKRLNVPVNAELLAKAKAYAEDHHTNVSTLVEAHFTRIVNKDKKVSVLDYLAELPKPL